MPVHDLGLIPSKRGSHCAARWNDQTNVVEVRTDRFPGEGDSGAASWTWVNVGIARSAGAAVFIAANYLRDE